MLRFCDSVGHYTFNTFTPDNARMLLKWTGTATTIGGGAASALGRFGVGGFQFFTGYSLYKDLDSQQTWILGIAFKLNYSAVETILLEVRDGASQQVEMRITSTGLVKVTRAGTQLAIGTVPISSYVWHFAELKVKIDNTTGTVQAKVNGVTHASASGIDTQATANAYANRIYIGGPQANVQLEMGDLYVCDDQGATNNDFLGDVRVECLFPNGNGNSSQFLGSDGNSTDNYLLVDEMNDPNGDTDYVESATVGNKDTYAYTNLTATSGTVYGLQILPYARQTDAGVRKIASVARHSGSELNSADETLSTSYQYLIDIRETKPGGGSWSISDINGAEFGVVVAA